VGHNVTQKLVYPKVKYSTTAQHDARTEAEIAEKPAGEGRCRTWRPACIAYLKKLQGAVSNSVQRAN
jgi:hypothetical protein